SSTHLMVKNGRRGNDDIVMSDERYPVEMPTLSVSSSDTTQNQPHVSDSQDGGRGNDGIVMSDERYPVEMPTFNALSQQQAPDSQDEGQDAPEEPLGTITVTSPLLARHIADQMQNPVPYQQQRHRVVGNPQTPGSKPFPKVILSQSIRDRASSNMMIWSFVQAMDNMAEGRV
ncbi:hypothetical protein GP486_008170, partial [Trichoglossum hirsutum]